MNQKNKFKKTLMSLFVILMVSFSFIPYQNIIGNALRVTINSEGKDESEGNIKTHVTGICGQDYRLVSPENSDIWEVNITIISELSTQPVHIRIYEVIGEYPYNYEEQTDVPYSRGTGQAILLTTLNVSKTYEVWIRDAYAKAFSGIITETWHPYIRNGGFEERDPTQTHFCTHWVDMGHTSYGSGSNTYQQSKVIGLIGSHSSNLWQIISLDRTDLVFSFWFRPYPEGNSITLQAFFSDIKVYEATYSGRYTEHEWRQVLVFLEPVFIDNNLQARENKIRS